MQYRERAHYSGGLIGFENPSQDDALASVVFCAVDEMYHVFLRRSPVENDPKYESIKRKIRDSNRRHNSNDPGIALDDRKKNGVILSIWFPGKIDLEDMVAIVEGVKEFDTAWLRAEFNKFKLQAGLEADDLPFLNYHDIYYQQDRMKAPWYQMSWYSAKGGTIFLESSPPEAQWNSFVHSLEQKSAQFEALKENVEIRLLSIRFTWAKPMKDLGETRKTLEHSLFEAISITPEFEEYQL